MDFLVFGGGGQVGTAFLREAERQGHTIVAPTRETVDIGDRDTVIRAVEDARPDVVINAAAYTHVDNAESEVELAFRINRDGAINVAVASATAGCPLVHLSTDYVFDGPEETWSPSATAILIGLESDADRALVHGRVSNVVAARGDLKEKVHVVGAPIALRRSDSP